MRPQLWLPVVACALAAPAACTFGADDFKVVAAGGESGGETSGGGNHPGGSTQQNSAGDGAAVVGGRGGAADLAEGGAADVATAGAGAAAGAAAGGQDSGATYNCSTRTQKLTIFSDVELGNAPLDRFVFVGGGASAAYAVATTDVQSGDTSLLVRRVTDSMNNPLDELNSSKLQGHFSFGGAYLAASVLHVIGADQRGIIDVAYALSARGELGSAAPAVTLLQTPADCGSGLGGVRDIKAAYDGSLSYAVTCQMGSDSLSLYLRSGDASLDPITDAGTETPVDPADLVVRQYTHAPDGTALLFTGSDGPGTVYARYGKTALELSTAHPIALGGRPDTTLFQMGLIFPLADYDGVYFFDTSLHDPGQGVVTPVTLYGGVLKSSAYSSFSQAPPPELVELAKYTKSDAVVLPNDAVVRGSGDVFVIGNDPLATSSIYTWMLDLSGRSLSERLTVFAPPASDAPTVDEAHGVQIGIGFFVGWREVGNTTSVVGRGVVCL